MKTTITRDTDDSTFEIDVEFSWSPGTGAHYGNAYGWQPGDPADLEVWSARRKDTDETVDLTDEELDDLAQEGAEIYADEAMDAAGAAYEDRMEPDPWDCPQV